jgi:hypothetical protein
MEAASLGITHNTLHDFALGSSGILDGFIVRLVSGLLKVDNLSMVGFPGSTVCPVFGLVAIAGRFVGIVGVIFILPVIQAVLPLVCPIMPAA